MQKLALMTTIGLLAIALATPLGTADHCNGDITDVGGVAYVEMRAGEDLPWIYLEDNGVEGLQSGGTSDAMGWDDPCAHANPDTLIF